MSDESPRTTEPFESNLERDFWMRMFERDGLKAADEALAALRERSKVPAQFEFALRATRDRWEAKLRVAFAHVAEEAKEHERVTGQPLDRPMRALFTGKEQGLRSAIDIIEHES